MLKQNTSGWLIEYYCENPHTKLLTRKQIKLSHIINRHGSKRAAKQHITQIIETLNTKLSGGWSPFFEGKDSRLYENLPSVCNKFMTYPETYINIRDIGKVIYNNEPDVVVQIKVKEKKRNDVLKLIFDNKDLEILKT